MATAARLQRVTAIQVTLLLSLGTALDAGQVVRTQEARAQPATATVGTSVTTAMTDWETSTSAVVSPEAKGIIGAELSGFAAKSIPEGATPFLARAYLYELRDKKGLPPGARLTLDVADVKGFSPSLFFSQSALGKRLGYLKCLSDPKGGDITIDGKASGRTVKEFVLSVGSHSVAISVPQEQCQETVEIQEGQSKESRCPRK